MDIETTTSRGDERLPILGYQRESIREMRNIVLSSETQMIFGITVNEMSRMTDEGTFYNACVNSLARVFTLASAFPASPLHGDQEQSDLPDKQ